jgi:hypothetical protein
MPDHPTDDVFEHGHPNPDSPLDEPLAESAAQDCDAKPEETDVRAVATEARFGDTEVSPRDEVAEQFPLEPLNAYIDQDGLPTIGDVQLSTAAPFDREHLVCLEDDREYVEVFSQDLNDRTFDCPELLYRALKDLNAPSLAPGFAALRSKWDDAGVARERRRFGANTLALARQALADLEARTRAADASEAALTVASEKVAAARAQATALTVVPWSAPTEDFTSRTNALRAQVDRLDLAARAVMEAERALNEARGGLTPRPTAEEVTTATAALAKAEKEQLVERYGLAFVNADGGDALLLVRMKRERCKNYKRQVMPNDDQPDENALGHRIYFRNCLARRSVGGALMTLRDEGVYACDYRDPPDYESVRIHLDERDRAAIERGTKGIEMVDLFNIKPKPKEAL